MSTKDFLLFPYNVWFFYSFIHSFILDIISSSFISAHFFDSYSAKKDFVKYKTFPSFPLAPAILWVVFQLVAYFISEKQMSKIPVCMGRYFLELPPWNHISLMSLFACWDNLCTYWVLSLCVSVNEERKSYKCVHDDWYQNEIYIFSSIEKGSRWILFPPVLFLFSGFYFSSNYENHILGIMCYLMIYFCSLHCYL